MKTVRLYLFAAFIMSAVSMLIRPVLRKICIINQIDTKAFSKEVMKNSEDFEKIWQQDHSDRAAHGVL